MTYRRWSNGGWWGLECELFKRNDHLPQTRVLGRIQDTLMVVDGTSKMAQWYWHRRGIKEGLKAEKETYEDKKREWQWTRDVEKRRRIKIERERERERKSRAISSRLHSASSPWLWHPNRLYASDKYPNMKEIAIVDTFFTSIFISFASTLPIHSLAEWQKGAGKKTHFKSSER